MTNRIIVRVACLLVVLGVLAAAPVSANLHKTYFTFSAPVRLPGVVLPPGTYVFERPSSMLDRTIVQVTDRTTSKLYFLALTRVVERAERGDLNSTITLGEAVQGAPRPVSVWFPQGETRGHQFIY
jgi:hypothetical protein